MNAEESGGLCEHQQIVSVNKHSRASTADKQSKYSGESIWGLGGLLHGGLFREVHAQGIQSISQVALNF